MQDGQNGNEPWLIGVRGEQVLPIITSDDPILRVEAGPGTGKTFGLVRRVQRILHPDGLNTDGKDVLVVAFNRVIAKQLQEDIGKCLADSAHNGEPTIKTAHALCLHVVGEKLRILLPHERTMLLYDVLGAHPQLKERLSFKKAKLALAMHEAKLIPDPALWQASARWLERHEARLVSELPSLLLDRLDGGDLGDERYEHVIVDEFQDLTPGLQKLFVKLRKPYGNLLALGDPRQSIYAFLGNDRGGLSTIDELVSPDTVTSIAMTECQRCPSQIVEAANQLTILSNAKPMLPVSSTEANIHVVHWKSPKKEAAGMATAILQNQKANPDDRHLVMVTRRWFGYLLRDEMMKVDPTIEIDLSFSESLLETWPVRESFLYFCLVTDADAPTWRSWLGYKNSVNGKDFKAGNRNSDAYLQFLTSCEDSVDVGRVRAIANQRKPPKGSGGTILQERAKRFDELQRDFPWNSSSDPLELIRSLFSITRWPMLDDEIFETASNDMDLARKKTSDIYEEVAARMPDATDDDRLREVTRILRYNIATKEPFVDQDDAKIQVSTLWGAKGVTAEHVYILGLCREGLPGERRDEYPGTAEDYSEEQRRLFYVSITRAKRTMVLSRATTIPRRDARNNGLFVQRPNDYNPTLQMCPFLRDILTFLPNSVPGEEWAGCADEPEQPF